MSLEMKYFVLKPSGNSIFSAASRIAMEAYADHIKDTDAMFAASLLLWVKVEMEKLRCAVDNGPAEAAPPTGDNTMQATPQGEITPDCDKCIYVKTGNENCSGCHNFNKYTPA